jgi:hypothetical protein|tara:strand:+ start:577 stop:912 length:336 start_codon:yes stop_codon:yes gene_type:complete
MTKKDLVKLIRAVVKSEAKKIVQTELNEAMNLLEQQKSSQQMSLTEAAKSTEEAPWPDMGNYNSSMRAQFAAMNGVSPQTDINNRPVDTSKLVPSVKTALTRDYRDLVKRF